MSIIQKAEEVRAVYYQIDKEVGRFKKESGFQCETGCHKCCMNPEISATILECVPLAFRFYSKGLAQEWLENLRHAENVADHNCLLFNPAPGKGKGNCDVYAYRPLLCRLFGFSAKMNKYGKPVLVTCATIKEKYPSQYIQVVEKIESGIKVPIMKDFFFRLYSIDSILSQIQYKINMAMRLAIEKVLLFFSYR